MSATKQIVSGEEILSEAPLISCQFNWNQLYGYLACDHCMKPLETVDENLTRLLNQPTTVPYPECCTTDKTSQVVCDCGSRYCCELCKQTALEAHHAVLCPFRNPKLDADIKELETLWRSLHYPPESASIGLLVRLLAIAKLESSQSSTNSK